MLAGVKIRLLPSDEHFSLRGDTLHSAMKEDMANGKIPFYVRRRSGERSIKRISLTF